MTSSIEKNFMKKITTYYTQIQTAVGKIYLLSDGTSLLALDFKKNQNYQDSIKDNSLTIFKQTEKELAEYFSGKRKTFKIKLAPKGTEFQKLAWQTLKTIPFGKVLSYGEQAKLMKKPKAQRATGSANGKNPIPIIIPCHRIITSQSTLGGYSGDIKLKKKLLEIEGHTFNQEKLVK